MFAFDHQYVPYAAACLSPFPLPDLTSHFFFSSRRRHTRFDCDWSSDVCSSDLTPFARIVLSAAVLEDVLLYAVLAVTLGLVGNRPDDIVGLPALLSLQRNPAMRDRKSTRLNSSHSQISYAVFCLKKKTYTSRDTSTHTRRQPRPAVSSLRRNAPFLRARRRLSSFQPPPVLTTTALCSM